MNETMSDREIDAWLAEHLFGWSVCSHGTLDALGRSRPGWCKGELTADFVDEGCEPCYSSTGDGMLMVLEAMRGRGAQGSLFVALPSMSGEPLCVARFERVDGPRVIHMVSNANVSAPRAVAEAAKAALEAEA